MRVLLLCLLLGAASAKYVDLPAPFTDDCLLEDNRDEYDQTKAFDIPWFTIDLDTPASERFRLVATTYAQDINDLIGVLKGLIVPIFPDAIKIVDEVFGELHDKIPNPYRDEISGIAKYSGVAVGEIVLYNIFYEIFTVCTSIIATDEQGQMYHARNLDFGLFLGWNGTSHEWEVSQQLRKMVININWIKDGKLLYKSNNFAGFVGIYNGLKPNAFTVTANERFQLEGGYVGILKWLLGYDNDGKWMTWLTRETLEEAVDYNDAKDRLANTPMLSPVYYILGGSEPFQGSIITRSLDQADGIKEMNATDPYGWYLLQTNYDPDTECLYLDDRQTPGDKCMRFLTKRRVGFPGIYNVLASRTNLNKLTTYTVLMQVNTGKFETHLQQCPGDCWPW